MDKIKNLDKTKPKYHTPLSCPLKRILSTPRRYTKGHVAKHCNMPSVCQKSMFLEKPVIPRPFGAVGIRPETILSFRGSESTVGIRP